jgi:hypothetical protein
MGIFESKQDRSIHSCTVHRTRLRFQRETQQSVVICRGDRCRLSLLSSKRVSNPACGYMKQETFETWFKAFVVLR